MIYSIVKRIEFHLAQWSCAHEYETFSEAKREKAHGDTQHTFILLSSFYHDVSIQFLQLSVQVVQPAVGRPELTVHL